MGPALYIVCLTPTEAKDAFGQRARDMAFADAGNRIVLFTDMEAFRATFTPLRVALLKNLADGGPPESIHELARQLGRGYRSVLRDVETLAAAAVFSVKASGPRGGDVPDFRWRHVIYTVSKRFASGEPPATDPRVAEGTAPAVDWDTWVDATGNAEDEEKIFAVGLRAYAGFMGPDTKEPNDFVSGLLRTIAGLIVRGFKRLERPELDNVHACLEHRGSFTEPALWEDPRHVAGAHQDIEEQLARGGAPTYQQLLVLAEQIEFHVRPNLLRLLWLARSASGKPGSYADAQVWPSGLHHGEQRSLKTALDELLQWVDGPGKRVLKKQDANALRDFAKSMSRDEADDRVGLDDIRNWVAHRDFFILPESILMGLHPDKAKAVRLTHADVTEWRRQLVGLMGITHAFKTMFLAVATGFLGAIEPKLT